MTAWIKTIDGSSTVEGTNGQIITDSAGNVYISGTSLIDNNNRCFVAKYNSVGTLQWDKGVGDNSTSETEGGNNFLAIDSTGNVYVSYAFNGGFNITKLNSSGTHQWSLQVSHWQGSDNSGSDFIQGLSLDSSDNLYAVGRTADQGYVAKFNSSGTWQWTRRIKSSSQSNATCRLRDIYWDGTDFYVTGGNNTYTGAITNTNLDLQITKVSTSGTVSNAGSVRYDASRTVSLEGYKLCGDSSGNTYSLDSTRDLVVKFNSSGTLQWAKTITGGSLSLEDITCQDGDLYLTGGDGGNAVIIKMDSTGAISYQRKLDHSSLTLYASRLITDSTYFYIYGESSANSNDFFVFKSFLDGSNTKTFGSYTYASVSTYSITTESYSAGDNPTNETITSTPIQNTTSRTVADVSMSETTTAIPIDHQASAALSGTATLSATGRRLIQNWEPYTWDSVTEWDSWLSDDWDRPNWRPAATATIFADGLIIVPGSADLSAQASVSITGTINYTGSAAVTAQASLTAQGGISTQGSSTMSAVATADFSARMGYNTSIFADGFATLTVDGEVGRTGSASLTATATTAQAGLVQRNASAALAASATISGALLRLVEGSASLTATASTSIDGQLVILSTATLTALATVNVTASTFKLAQANLQGFASVLSVGQFVNEDNILIIDQETRTLLIPQETRILDIKQETRTLHIQGTEI